MIQYKEVSLFSDLKSIQWYNPKSRLQKAFDSPAPLADIVETTVNTSYIYITAGVIDDAYMDIPGGELRGQ